jgi:DNA-binding HxlR family transcriptional regulator
MEAGFSFMTTRSSQRPAAPERRSPCPVACSLDLFGDRWTLLVVRDLLLGRTRYKEFQESPEGIPTNILAERLERLVVAEIVTRVPAADGSRHLAYRLTRKGLALRPILKAMRDWGLTWEPGTRVGLAPVSGRLRAV